jgi:TPR repeat protein
MNYDASFEKALDFLDQKNFGKAFEQLWICGHQTQVLLNSLALEGPIDPVPYNTTEKVFNRVLKDAQCGNVLSQYIVATIFKREKNYESSLYWFMKAGLQGHAESLYQVGVCFFRGIGTTVNLEKSLTWFKMANVKRHYAATMFLQRYNEQYVCFMGRLP